MRIRALTSICATTAFLSLALICGADHRAHASIVLALELDQLTAQANEIGFGKVVSKETRRLKHSIVTIVRIVIDESIKGSHASGDEVEIRTLGGIVDGIGMKVEGEASFALGERTVFFVRRDARASLRPVGMAQGVMHIRSEGKRQLVVPSHRGLSLVSKTARGSLVNAPPALLQPMPLAEFLNKVRGIVAAQKTR